MGDIIDRGPDGFDMLVEIMDMPNVLMLLGNHEYMMLQYLSSGATGTEIQRWNRNGNAPTLAAYLKEKAKVQRRIISYLRGLPPHIELELNDKRFYLVHLLPVENVHEEVWTRPKIDTANPKPGYQVIIGHTKVLSMIKPEEARIRYAIELEDKGEHLRTLHAPGFANIDCGCGYDMPIKALACLSLEDLVEYYI